MAKFFLSTVLFLLTVASCHAAANNLGDRLYRLKDTNTEALSKAANRYIDNKQLDSALMYLSVIVDRYRSNPDDQKHMDIYLKAFEYTGIIYMCYIYDYRKSYDYLLQAKEIGEKHGKILLLGNVYNCLANILQISSDDNHHAEKRKVETYLRMAFYTAYKANDPTTMSLALDNLITFSMDRRPYLHLDKEANIFRKFMAKCKKQDITYAWLRYKGYEAFISKQYTRAIAIFRTAKKKKWDSPLYYRTEISCQNAIAKCYSENSDYDAAERELLVALEIAKRNKALDYETDLYNKLSELYQKGGDTIKSRDYNYLYLQNKVKMQDEAHLSAIKNVKFMRELNTANEQMRTLSARHRMQTIILTVSLAVVLVIGFLLFRLYHAYGKIRQANRQLYKNNVELLEREAKALEKRKKLNALSHNSTNSSASEATIAAPAKYQNSRLSEQDIHDLYNRICDVMENADDIYQLEFNIDKLSELVHSRPRYVSQAINQEFGQNFNAFLNDYRIKEACRRLNGKEGYSHLSIESIAESVGYKSRTSFSALFKSMTGLSPSAYQKMAHKEA